MNFEVSIMGDKFLVTYDGIPHLIFKKNELLAIHSRIDMSDPSKSDAPKSLFIIEFHLKEKVIIRATYERYEQWTYLLKQINEKWLLV